jgi:hypothetical protein
MGSIGDIVIAPEAGHKIDEDETEAANATLLTLIHRLYADTSRLLEGGPGT